MVRFESVSPRLVVDDLKDTVAFYLGVLGFDDWSGWPEEEPTFAIVSRDGLSVQFQQSEGTDSLTAETTTLHFTVNDAMAIYRQLEGNVTIEWGPEVYAYGRREFAIRDCNGVMLIFSQVTSDPPTDVD